MKLSKKKKVLKAKGKDSSSEVSTDTFVKETLSRSPSVKESPKTEFHPSKWTIRYKLITIISGLIVISLSLMIALATFFFKSDSEVRIQENNINLTDVIGQKISSEIQSLASLSKVVATTLEQSPGVEGVLVRSLFESDKNLIFVGSYSVSENSLIPRRKFFNPAFLTEREISRETIDKITNDQAKFFRQSANGITKVQNVSTGFNYPIVGISFPYSSGDKSIIVCYVKLEKFLGAFQSSGITVTYLVNSDGKLIAHPDSQLVKQGLKFSDVPIVKAMKESSVDSGLTKYKDKNGESFIGSYKKLSAISAGIISTVSEKKAFEEVYNIQRRNFYLMVVVVNIAILIVYLFSKSLTLPILKLVGASKQIERGQYAINIQPTTRDEIGILTNSFLSMVSGLIERENLKTSFGKFVNKEIAELASKGELNLGGERKTCTVFFSDIRGFTSLSEKLPPEEVVEFLNSYLHEMVACVKQKGGNVDKFIGDAIMAAWGTTKSHDDDARNAIECALLMREALLKYNRGRGSSKKPVIKIGVGINTGPVVVGQIGSDEKLDFTVIGDAVNIAARLESLNKTVGTDILVSESTLGPYAKYFKTEKLQPITVKGKSEPVIVYAILGRANDPKAPKSIKELRELVGIDFKASSKKNSDS